MTPQFWTRLTEHRSENVFNPWSDSDPLDLPFATAAERRGRLESHFHVDAKYLLIGEAPGYRGCHFSGIPFTCEKQLFEGIVPRVGPPAQVLSGCAVRAAQQLERRRITTRELPWSEGSATVIWSTLHELGIAERTVMFNAFPWHPHLPDNPLSNRTPTPREVVEGAPILAMVLEQFRGAQVIAVGQIALRTLGSLGITAIPVRHPSMGGARQFKAQLRELVVQAVAA
jgi:uracil-DNA glycosylase